MGTINEIIFFILKFFSISLYQICIIIKKKKIIKEYILLSYFSFPSRKQKKSITVDIFTHGVSINVETNLSYEKFKGRKAYSK